MDEHEWLGERFEENRTHLRAVAYRMLGSLSEAEDAVQEAWLKISRSSANGVENLSGWLTTVLARVCLDMLRSRKSRREELQGVQMPSTLVSSEDGMNPENEALLAGSVGLALLVVLEKLEPAERLAFVLHDMFAVSFDEIASIVGRSESAARQLASRARRRVQGRAAVSGADLTGHRKVVDAFLAALRDGDFDALVAVLDPYVVVRVESAEGVKEIRGARTWAKGALAFSRYARFTQPALVDGSVGILMAPGGRLLRILRLTIKGGKIVEVEIVVDPEHLRQLDVSVLTD